MGLLAWLDLVPDRVRRWLLAATVAVLALSTGFLRSQHDVLAGFVVVGLGVAWVGVWARIARPERARREAERQAAEARYAENLGRLVAGAVLPRGGLSELTTTDPAFSLPVLDDILRSLHRGACESAGPELPWVHAPPRVLSVRRDGGRTELVAELRARGADGVEVCRSLHLSRTAARSPPPHLLSNPGWRVDRWEATEPAAHEPIGVDPAMPAARRALLVRQNFDVAAFEELVEKVDAAIEAAAKRPSGLDRYATSGGVEAVQWWLGSGGLPPTGKDSRWLSVEEDGWYHRIEVQRGERVLGLLRPSGEPRAPWRLWRVRRA